MANTQELTDFLLTTLKETKTFVVEQAPDVAKEMLEYGVYDAKMSIWIGGGCLIAALIFFIICQINDGYNSVGTQVITGILSLVFFLVGVFSIPCGISTLKKIEVAPKVYLIEQLTKPHCGK